MLCVSLCVSLVRRYKVCARAKINLTIVCGKSKRKDKKKMTDRLRPTPATLLLEHKGEHLAGAADFLKVRRGKEELLRVEEPPQER